MAFWPSGLLRNKFKENFTDRLVAFDDDSARSSLIRFLFFDGERTKRKRNLFTQIYSNLLRQTIKNFSLRLSHLIIALLILVLSLAVALNEEVSEKEDKDYEVDDLQVEEPGSVAIGKDGNDAMCDDHGELSELKESDEWLDPLCDVKDVLALEGAEEVVSVHDDVDY